MASLYAEILENAKTIAVVGLSDNYERTSNRVTRYMKECGYKIIPVNPNISEALGEKAYPVEGHPGEGGYRQYFPPL